MDQRIGGASNGEAQSAWALVVMSAGTSFVHPLPSTGEVTIGRGDDCSVVLDDPKASHCHLVLRAKGGVLSAVDRGSRNGSFLGSRKLLVDESVKLEVGDILRVGSTLLLVKPARSRERVRLVGEGSLGARMAAVQAQGVSFWLLEVSLVLQQRDGRAPTWNDGDPEVQGLVVRFDALLDEHVDASSHIAEMAPSRRRVLLIDADMAAAQRIAATLGAALTIDGIDAEVRILAGHAAPQPSGARAPSSTPPPALSDEMQRLSGLVDRVAGGHVNVIILGETGVGKEVMARKLHARSPRASGSLVCLNCAAFSETLLETELFGHEKGAFTGAVRDKPGLLESANGGVIFLDEIGEMPLALQAKLLRVIEQQEVQRVGSLRPRPIDVRFFAATNRDLEGEVRAKRFRRDLYFRLNGFTLTIPPLRRRLEEIESLARQYVVEASAACGRTPPALLPDAIEALRLHDWPGNIRELRNVIDRAVMLSHDESITREHLAITNARGALASLRPSAPPSAAPNHLPADEAQERARILDALERCAGNQTHAAEHLGISRGTLIKRLAKYNVRRPRQRG